MLQMRRANQYFFLTVGRNRTDRYIPPFCDDHCRPCRPLPAVCSIARKPLPDGAPFAAACFARSDVDVALCSIVMGQISGAPCQPIAAPSSAFAAILAESSTGLSPTKKSKITAIETPRTILFATGISASSGSLASSKYIILIIRK